MKKIYISSVVSLFFLLTSFFVLPNSASAQCASPNGCFDCQWASGPGTPQACRALNIQCSSGYTADFDRCGQLTPQGSVVCEAAGNQDLPCVQSGGGGGGIGVLT